MVLGQYMAILAGTWWYWFSISWYCLVLGGTWSAKGLYACIYWKKWRFGRVTPMPDTLTHSQTTENRATQLVSSIKHKLSHAMYFDGTMPVWMHGFAKYVQCIHYIVSTTKMYIFCTRHV